MDALANPSVQHGLSIALAVVAVLGALTFLGMVLGARRSTAARARVFRRQAGVVGLFVAVAAGAAFALLSLSPAETRPHVQPGGATASEPQSGPEVVSARRFSSARLPALSLDAPDGWSLELDKASKKLTASSDAARLLISTAVLTETVDAESLLGQLAERQRALGFEVGDRFADRLGDLPAAGFVATVGARSVCAWMVKRDTHLASSVICSSEGKQSARDACRAPLASLRWRAPSRAADR